MDEDVLPHLDFRHMLQANALGYAAEIDLTHQDIVLAVGLDDFAGDAEAHCGSSRSRGFASLAAATASCPKLRPPSFGGTNRCRLTRKPLPLSRATTSRVSSAF